MDLGKWSIPPHGIVKVVVNQSKTIGYSNNSHPFPGLKDNLFSISMASAISGAKIVIENGLCQVMNDGKIALNAKKQRRVFRVMVASVTEPEG